jgi:hypothetical protein
MAARIKRTVATRRFSPAFIEVVNMVFSCSRTDPLPGFWQGYGQGGKNKG